MPKIELGDYCCQANGKTVDTSSFSTRELVLAARGNRELIFSPLGNNPVKPSLALVGITPGGQFEAFERYMRSSSVPVAAARAAFEGAQTQIKQLLNSHGFASHIGIDLAGDLNGNPAIFTTSLVKCCLKVNGSYQYKAPDIAASPEAIYCVTNRFLTDISRFPSLEWIVIFGDPGWDAVTQLRIEGRTILDRLRVNGAEVLNFPHFSQNFQQRAIFCLKEQDEQQYLEQRPKQAPYAPKARRMRLALLNAMRRHASVV